MKFSQRIGISPIKTILQIDSMDNDLKIGLWNSFTYYCLNKAFDRMTYISDQDDYYKFFISLWCNFFKLPLDSLKGKVSDLRNFLKDVFMKWKWYEVYDFIEFIVKEEIPDFPEEFKDDCNRVMKRELSGYRIIENEIVRITDENEIKEIEEAIKKSDEYALKGVENHLRTALSIMADKKNHNYRNSIKESISAVESISQIITKNPKATLGEALKVLDKHIEIHEALKKGFNSIYGYTSDAGGIRHAMIDDSDVDFEDAKYMFVACSAFINYLIIKASKSKISLK